MSAVKKFFSVAAVGLIPAVMGACTTLDNLSPDMTNSDLCIEQEVKNQQVLRRYGHMDTQNFVISEEEMANIAQVCDRIYDDGFDRYANVNSLIIHKGNIVPVLARK